MDTIDTLYKTYNEFIITNGYDVKYEISEATFIRMKEDYMLNGQLKLDYNVQIATITVIVVLINKKCLYKYNEETDSDKNKTMKINELWKELQAESRANITSEKGILNRQICSIQTEGHFTDIKGNEKFRRFSYCSSEKVSV